VKIPNYQNAVISEGKLAGYCCPHHMHTVVTKRHSLTGLVFRLTLGKFSRKHCVSMLPSTRCWL
jgi:hypothetical protein